MDLKTLMPWILQASLILVVVAVGLQSRWSDLTCALRTPRLLVGGAVAVNVVVPLAAVLTALVLPIDPLVKAGIVIMAVSPLAPFAPGKMLKGGAETSITVGLYVALILLAVLIVPMTVALLSTIFSVDLTVPVSAMAWLVLSSVLAPLVVGIAIAALAPGAAPRLAKIAGLVGNLLLLPILALFLYNAGGAILGLIGDGTLIAIVATVAAGLAAGHLLGGPERDNRIALALAAATRHPGVAGLIAHRHFDDRRVMLAVVLFLIVSILLSALYQRWVRSAATETDLPETPSSTRHAGYPPAKTRVFPDEPAA